MISAFFSFITRAIILNPMAIIGIVIGAYCMHTYTLEALKILALSPYIWGGLFAIALLYACLFQHVYYLNSKQIDWWATIKSSFTHLITIVIAIVLTCIIIFAYNYAFADKLDAYLRYKKSN